MQDEPDCGCGPPTLPLGEQGFAREVPDCGCAGKVSATPAGFAVFPQERPLPKFAVYPQQREAPKFAVFPQKLEPPTSAVFPQQLEPPTFAALPGARTRRYPSGATASPIEADADPKCALTIVDEAAPAGWLATFGRNHRRRYPWVNVLARGTSPVGAPHDRIPYGTPRAHIRRCALENLVPLRTLPIFQWHYEGPSDDWFQNPHPHPAYAVGCPGEDFDYDRPLSVLPEPIDAGGHRQGAAGIEIGFPGDSFRVESDGRPTQEIPLANVVAVPIGDLLRVGARVQGWNQFELLRYITEDESAAGRRRIPAQVTYGQSTVSRRTMGAPAYISPKGSFGPGYAATLGQHDRPADGPDGDFRLDQLDITFTMTVAPGRPGWLGALGPGASGLDGFFVGFSPLVWGGAEGPIPNVQRGCFAVVGGGDPNLVYPEQLGRGLFQWPRGPFPGLSAGGPPTFVTSGVLRRGIALNATRGDDGSHDALAVAELGAQLHNSDFRPLLLSMMNPARGTELGGAFSEGHHWNANWWLDSTNLRNSQAILKHTPKCPVFRVHISIVPLRRDGEWGLRWREQTIGLGIRLQDTFVDFIEADFNQVMLATISVEMETEDLGRQVVYVRNHLTVYPDDVAGVPRGLHPTGILYDALEGYASSTDVDGPPLVRNHLWPLLGSDALVVGAFRSGGTGTRGGELQVQELRVRLRPFLRASYPYYRQVGG